MRIYRLDHAIDFSVAATCCLVALLKRVLIIDHANHLSRAQKRISERKQRHSLATDFLVGLPFRCFSVETRSSELSEIRKHRELQSPDCFGMSPRGGKRRVLGLCYYLWRSSYWTYVAPAVRDRVVRNDAGLSLAVIGWPGAATMDVFNKYYSYFYGKHCGNHVLSTKKTSNSWNSALIPGLSRPIF